MYFLYYSCRGRSRGRKDIFLNNVMKIKHGFCWGVMSGSGDICGVVGWFDSRIFTFLT